MKKYKRLINSMFISMLLSVFIIWIFKYKFNDFENAETICNIFIGILGSSFVTLIGYYFEYFNEKRENKRKLFECYKEVRFRIIPIIESTDNSTIDKIMDENIIYDLRTILNDYRFFIRIYECVSNINIFKKYEIDIWDLPFINKYIRIIYILSKIHDYFTGMNSSIYIQNFLINEYKENYHFMKSFGVSNNKIKEVLKPTEDVFKSYKKYEKEMNQMICSLKLKEKCRELDISLGIFKVE